MIYPFIVFIITTVYNHFILQRLITTKQGLVPVILDLEFGKLGLWRHECF